MGLPREGSRLNHSGCLGTVRFVGLVDNTTGTWLGVEWDDPERGKHDGVKDGKRYFHCRVPNAGSFIRPSASISYGRSFLDALVAKYNESLHGSGSQEKVILGSSHGAIEVEAVDLDKVRAKLANLERLREVSLDMEDVASCDAPGAIKKTCPSIRGLDLSMNLLPGWDEVSSITAELPQLQRLALNRCRLLVTNLDRIRDSFSSLADLQLNGTMTTWQEMQEITSMMPRLLVIEMGYNRLSYLSSPGPSLAIGSNIQVINLDSNFCHDWVHLCEALIPYSCLQRVMLTSNEFETIPFPEPGQQQLDGLKHLSLSSNRLKSWADIDALAAWCPALETLSLTENPLFVDHGLAQHSRPFAVSKIPTLLSLDGAAISRKERADCEIFYLSHVVQNGPKTEKERAQAHPRWPSLCKRHGAPDEALHDQTYQEKLSNQLIVLHLSQKSDDLQVTSPDREQSRSIQQRVLPTMALRTLRAKVGKAMKENGKTAKIDLWLKMGDNTLVELGRERDKQDLAWLGLEDDSQILFRITKN